MTQLHKRFSDEQIKVLLQGYCRRILSRAEVQEVLGIGKSRFFALVKGYREDPEGFTVSYRRPARSRLCAAVEAEIKQALLQEKEIVEDPRLPISGYNYSAVRDRLLREGIRVSLNTIISRAKDLGCYKPRRKRKSHDREVVTVAIGALLQHDASTHLWSPFAQEKWALVTTIDDFSRKLLFADFFPAETTWAHIQAAQAVIQSYGVPLCYYVDCLRVFRFVQGRDSFWRKHTLQTDDVDTQWGKVMRVLGVEVKYALSPQAKGKIERPYRWLQDRIVRTCALERIGAVRQVRAVLQTDSPTEKRRCVGTITVRSIPPPRRSPAFGSTKPEEQATVSSVPSPCPSPTPLPKTSSAFGRPDSSMDTDAFPSSTIGSPYPTCLFAPRFRSTWSPTCRSRPCTSASGGNIEECSP